MGDWTRPKTLWEEKTCNLCDTDKAKNEKQSLIFHHGLRAVIKILDFMKMTCINTI